MGRAEYAEIVPWPRRQRSQGVKAVTAKKQSSFVRFFCYISSCSSFVMKYVLSYSARITPPPQVSEVAHGDLTGAGLLSPREQQIFSGV